MNVETEETFVLCQQAVKVLLDREQRWMTESEIAEALGFESVQDPIFRVTLSDLQRFRAVRFKHEDCDDEALGYCLSSYASLTLGMTDGLHRRIRVEG